MVQIISFLEFYFEILFESVIFDELFSLFRRNPVGNKLLCVDSRKIDILVLWRGLKFMMMGRLFSTLPMRLNYRMSLTRLKFEIISRLLWYLLLLLLLLSLFLQHFSNSSSFSFSVLSSFSFSSFSNFSFTIFLFSIFFFSSLSPISNFLLSSSRF